MAKKSRATFKKRQRELARQQKRQEKLHRRMQRKVDRENDPQESFEIADPFSLDIDPETGEVIDHDEDLSTPPSPDSTDSPGQ